MSEVVEGPLLRVSSMSKGTKTRSTRGITKDMIHKIIGSIAMEATILQETSATQMSPRDLVYISFCIQMLSYIGTSENQEASQCLTLPNSTTSGRSSYIQFLLEICYYILQH